jgi:hypothetical protein
MFYDLAHDLSPSIDVSVFLNVDGPVSALVRALASAGSSWGSHPLLCYLRVCGKSNHLDTYVVNALINIQPILPLAASVSKSDNERKPTSINPTIMKVGDCEAAYVRYLFFEVTGLGGRNNPYYC